MMAQNNWHYAGGRLGGEKINIVNSCDIVNILLTLIAITNSKRGIGQIEQESRSALAGRFFLLGR